MKWEYKVVSVFHLSRTEIESEFCRLGAEGWRLAWKDIDYATYERELATAEPVQSALPPAVPRSTEARLRRAKTA